MPPPTFATEAVLRLPRRFAVAGKVHGNPIVQLATLGSSVSLGAKLYGERGQPLGRILTEKGKSDRLAVRQASAARDGYAEILLVRNGDHAFHSWPSKEDLASARWMKPAPTAVGDGDLAAWLHRCSAVRSSWLRQVHLHEETREGDTITEPGLRPPQTGAIYAALAHWRVTHAPATIVMPTGTGKTETMLALLVNERLPRLLVVVPNRALRDQTVEKFTTLGLLKTLGILDEGAELPVTGTLLHKPKTPDEVDNLFLRCNVVVTTMNIVGQCPEAIQQRMAEQCSHLFIDEAHHIPAPTWDSFRRAFLDKCVLQFTATPFRTDGKYLEGKVIFNYPLRKAQEEGYFRPITFRPIDEIDRATADREIARVAVEQLQADLSVGLDHIVMARANGIQRAQAVHAIYQDLAPEQGPILLHSEVSDEDSQDAMRKLWSRESRIVVCVDMLGEGFDLPQLKIAALHEMHKSLAITLQFTGRFTRTQIRSADIGDATVIANIADPDVEERLQGLYAENADWNFLLRTLSEGATGRHVKKTEFLERFLDPPPEVALQNIEPKMSAVVYRTRCVRWQPNRAIEALKDENIYAGPVLNPVDRVVLAITRVHEPVRWGTVKDVSNVVWDLYLLHWDPERNLLFINSSNNDSLHDKLAEAVCGDDVELICGETVFRTLHGITRLVLMNLGLNHTVSRSIRFSMHVGSDIGPAIADATIHNKTKSNLFGVGFENGSRTTIGCSQKGRLWSHLIAYDMSEWVEWCHKIGDKLIDPSISTREPFDNLIVPKFMTERPALVPLAIEWGTSFFESHEDEISISIAGETAPFYETRLDLISHTDSGPIRFRVTTGTQSATYELQFGERGVDYVPVGLDIVDVSIRRRRGSLTEWFRKDSPVVFFADGSTLANHQLYTPPTINNRAPYPVERIVAWDWTGADLKVESQTAARRVDSIQRRVILDLLSSATNPPWDVVFDDDDANEAADVVAIRSEGSRIIVHFFHCKYAHGDAPGARVGDLYEVCGQAQRSIRWKNNVAELFRHLRHREEARIRRIGVTRYDRGDPAKLAELNRLSRQVPTEFKVFIVQPGISKADVSKAQLDLLAATELYLKDTSSIDLMVIASP